MSIKKDEGWYTESEMKNDLKWSTRTSSTYVTILVSSHVFVLVAARLHVYMIDFASTAKGNV